MDSGRRINKSNLKWLGRMGAILVLVCVLDMLLAAFVPHPKILIGLVSGLLPLMTVALVMAPALKAYSGDKTEPQA